MLCGENDEGDDGDVTGAGLQVVVQSGERLNEDVPSLITELIAAGSEEEQRLVQIEVDVTVEMSVDKIKNLKIKFIKLNISFLLPHLLFVDLVEVLELVALSLHIQPIGRDQVGLSLDEMLSFLSRDIADRGEHVREMSRCSLQTISVVDLPLPGLHTEFSTLIGRALMRFRSHWSRAS